MRCASGHKVTALRRAISDEDYRLLKEIALRVPLGSPTRLCRGGESGDIGRPNERGAFVLCDSIVERVE